MGSDVSQQPKDEHGTIVKVRDVHTRFGEKVVHKGISFDVRKGEVFAIVGGSGSGKSTIMREIAILQPPTEGSVTLFGKEVSDMSDIEALPLRRRMGVMFQYGALFNNLNVLENVCVPLQEHTEMPTSLIEEIAAVKIELVGLELETCAMYPNQLSGGMRKRAAMARAIALDPEIIFLDEPSSGLDPVSADGLDELILKLKELMGLTIVMVTHDMDSLWRVADSVILLGDAQIKARGSMREVLETDDPLVTAFFKGNRGRAAHSLA